MTRNRLALVAVLPPAPPSSRRRPHADHAGDQQGLPGDEGPERQAGLGPGHLAADRRARQPVQLQGLGHHLQPRRGPVGRLHLPPILSGNRVNDQTERPEFVVKKVGSQYKYSLFTISHKYTYAAGLNGPDGVYGFVGDGIRSDFQPPNTSGLALGNPTHPTSTGIGADGNATGDTHTTGTHANDNPRQFQSYSHHVMPGGLVKSFIDNVDGRRGGTLAPTVKINIGRTSTSVDRTVGRDGLLDQGWIPSQHDIHSLGHGNGLRTVRAAQVR